MRLSKYFQKLSVFKKLIELFFIRNRLILSLLFIGVKKIKAFDIRPVHSELQLNWTTQQKKDYVEKVQFFEGDIRNQSLVNSFVKDCNLIFHIASYGMSGREQLQKKLIYGVNVNGTERIIENCKSENVPFIICTTKIDLFFIFKNQFLSNKIHQLIMLFLEDNQFKMEVFFKNFQV